MATRTSEPIATDDGADMTLPALEDITRGTPSGWGEFEQAGLRFALPPEFAASPSQTTENGTLIARYHSDQPATPSMNSQVVVQSWLDQAGFLRALPDDPKWHTFRAPGSAHQIVALTHEPHIADNGDTEMFTCFTFQLDANDGRAYELQAYLPINDTNETTLRKIAGSMSID